ncbi:hypothetical protein N9164_08690 [Draconibacterium sp.]|nr:hypothetical protein [Draconibacterium sp.]
MASSSAVLTGLATTDAKLVPCGVATETFYRAIQAWMFVNLLCTFFDCPDGGRKLAHLFLPIAGRYPEQRFISSEH